MVFIIIIIIITTTSQTACKRNFHFIYSLMGFRAFKALNGYQELVTHLRCIGNETDITQCDFSVAPYINIFGGPAMPYQNGIYCFGR